MHKLSSNPEYTKIYVFTDKFYRFFLGVGGLEFANSSWIYNRLTILSSFEYASQNF